MSEMKPTPGEWIVSPMTPCRVDTLNGAISVSWSSNHDCGAREREAEANARLIAEAGTVHHETGLTPRQLVERVKELEGALRGAQQAINGMKVEAETAAQGDEQMMLEACETISNEGLQTDMEIRAALSKSLPNTVAETPT